MKARIKATGEIEEVNEFCTLRDSGERIYYWANALELITKDNPDYWTRLEHQYAGMAMQGLCANYTEFTKVNDGTVTNREMIAENARLIAHALVEKMKEERK